MMSIFQTPKLLLPRVYKQPLQQGCKAPDFTLPDVHGAPFCLRDSAAAGEVLLVFMPHAFTPVCGMEVQQLMRAGHELDAQIAVVSCDTKHTLLHWWQGFTAGGGSTPPLRLLSDFWPHGAVAKRYGAFNYTTGAATRTSFVIDSKLRVQAVVQAQPQQQRSFAAYEKALKTARHAV